MSAINRFKISRATRAEVCDEPKGWQFSYFYIGPSTGGEPGTTGSLWMSPEGQLYNRLTRPGMRIEWRIIRVKDEQVDNLYHFKQAGVLKLVSIETYLQDNPKQFDIKKAKPKVTVSEVITISTKKPEDSTDGIIEDMYEKPKSQLNQEAPGEEPEDHEEFVAKLLNELF